MQLFWGGLADNGYEYPIHAHRTAQRSVVRHRVGTCAGWETKTKIEQAIPYVGGGTVIGETDELIIICVAEGNIGRQAITKFAILVGVDWGIKGMRITDQTMLRVGQAGDHTIVRIGTGQSRFPISGKIRAQEMIVQIEQT